MTKFTVSNLPLTGGKIQFTSGSNSQAVRLGRKYTDGHNGLNGVMSYNFSGARLGLINLAHAVQLMLDPDGTEIPEDSPHVDANGYLQSWDPAWGANSIFRAIGLADFESPGFHDSLHGDYVFRWDGDPNAMRISGIATNVDASVPNQISFTLAQTDNIIIYQSETTTGSWPTNFRMIPTNLQTAYDNGERWRPEFLDLIRSNTAGKGVSFLRFMDALDINFPTWTSASQLMNVDKLRWNAKFIPLPVIIDLCNQLGCDAWICIPHTLTAIENTGSDLMEHVRTIAEYVRDNLNKDLKCYVEWSNEVWNFNFMVRNTWLSDQTAAAGWAAGGDLHASYTQKIVTLTMKTFTEVFGVETSDRLVRVAGFGRAQNDSWNRPLFNSTQWEQEEPGATFAISDYIDAVSPASYFGGDMLIDPTTRQQTKDAIQAATSQQEANIALKGVVESGGYIQRTLTEIAAIKADHPEKRLVLYEGGNHTLHSFGGAVPEEDLPIVTPALGAFAYSTQMVEIYADLYDGLVPLVDGPFMQYYLLGPASKFGAWAAFTSTITTNPLGDFVNERNLTVDRWWVDDRALEAT